MEKIRSKLGGQTGGQNTMRGGQNSLYPGALFCSSVYLNIFIFNMLREGSQTFTPVTGVQIPLGTPINLWVIFLFIKHKSIETVTEAVLQTLSFTGHHLGAFSRWSFILIILTSSPLLHKFSRCCLVSSRPSDFK